MGRLKNLIDNMILEYPALYLKKYYTQSEMAVLSQIFFTIGGGFEWIDGLPLKEAGESTTFEYREVNTEWFCHNQDKIWWLDINPRTFEFCRYFKFDYMKEYSTLRNLYAMNIDTVKRYNASVPDEFLNNKMPDAIRRFQRCTDIWMKDYLSFYPLDEEYSLLFTMLEQDYIHPEAVNYALSLVDFAEKHYSDPNYKETHKECLKRFPNIVEEQQKMLKKWREAWNKKTNRKGKKK